jgi:hypothetical protein
MSQLYQVNGQWMTIDQVKKFRELEAKKRFEEESGVVMENIQVEEAPIEEVKEEETPIEVPREVQEVEDYLSMDTDELRAYARSKGIKFRGMLGKEKLIKLLEQ